MNIQRSILFVALILITLLFVLVDFISGSVNIPLHEIFSAFTNQTNSEWQSILWKIRFPRIITAVLAGAALSISGLQMQTIFRNPLAGPFVLGISAGASLGVAIVVLGFAGIFSGLSLGISGNWLIIVAAWMGSAAILLIILFVSYRIKDIMTLLIIGIMFGSATAALVNIMQYFTSENLLKSFIIWTMGSLSGVSLNQMQLLAPVILVGLMMSLTSVKLLNVSLMGEHYARSMGLNVMLTRVYVFTSTSILTGTITAFCGPIGFVGIAVPHLARMLFKTTDHKILIPATMIMGALLMVVSDIVSHLPGSYKTLPLNSVTAIIGIPIIIWIIIKNRKLVAV